jgi:enoyl-[acyl-carrier-protein] reductase (NADH)
MGFLQNKKILVTGLLSNRSIAYGIARALHREGATLAKASQLTGYATEASFSYAFRQWAGVAPGEWRRKLKSPSA